MVGLGEGWLGAGGRERLLCGACAWGCEGAWERWDRVLAGDVEAPRASDGSVATGTRELDLWPADASGVSVLSGGHTLLPHCRVADSRGALTMLCLSCQHSFEQVSQASHQAPPRAFVPPVPQAARPAVSPPQAHLPPASAASPAPCTNHRQRRRAAAPLPAACRCSVPRASPGGPPARPLAACPPAWRPPPARRALGA